MDRDSEEYQQALADIQNRAARVVWPGDPRKLEESSGPTREELLDRILQTTRAWRLPNKPTETEPGPPVNKQAARRRRLRS